MTQGDETLQYNFEKEGIYHPIFKCIFFCRAGLILDQVGSVMRIGLSNYQNLLWLYLDI